MRHLLAGVALAAVALSAEAASFTLTLKADSAETGTLAVFGEAASFTASGDDKTVDLLDLTDAFVSISVFENVSGSSYFAGFLDGDVEEVSTVAGRYDLVLSTPDGVTLDGKIGLILAGAALPADPFVASFDETIVTATIGLIESRHDAAAAVPLPAALPMLALALGGFGALRRFG